MHSRSATPRGSGARVRSARGTKTTTCRSVPVVTDWQRRSARASAPVRRRGRVAAASSRRGRTCAMTCTSPARLPAALQSRVQKLRVAGRGACRTQHREYVIPLSVADLRRTFAIWLRASGLSPAVLGAALRTPRRTHGRRVYGKLTRRCWPTACAPNQWDTGGTEQGGLGWIWWTDWSTRCRVPPRRIPRDSVPRDGIRPPTRGIFRSLCWDGSTAEKTR